MPIVDVPGQGLVEFPDAMTDAEIGMAISRQRASSIKQPEAGFIQGVGQQIGKNFDVAAANIGKVIPALDVIGQTIGMPNSQDVLAQRKDAPISTASRVVGDIASTLPTMALPGGQAKLGQALYGAATGAALSETDPLMAAGIGAAAPTAVRAAGKAISGAVLDPAQKLLKSAGVSLTPGQIAGGGAQVVEDVLANIPFVGASIQAARQRGLEQFNRGAYQQSLAGASAVLPSSVGREGVQQLKDIGQGLYAKATRGTQFQADPALASAYQAARADLASGAGGQRAVDEFDRIIGRVNQNLTGVSSGDKLSGVISDLGKQASAMMGGDTAERMAATKLSAMQSALLDSLERQNPAAAESLRNARTAYKGYKTVSRASVAAQEANDGMFTPQQLVTATRQTDRSLGKDAYARGQAMMQDYAAAGQRILPQKLGDSGTATRGLVPAVLAGGGSLAGLLSPGAVVGAATIPAAYSPAGITLLDALLTARPEIARKAGKDISKAALPISAGLLGGTQ